MPTGVAPVEPLNEKEELEDIEEDAGDDVSYYSYHFNSISAN